MKNLSIDRKSERGSAGSRFIIFLVIMGLIAHAGYNFVPVQYQAESMRSEMNTAVLQGIAMPGKMNPLDNVKARIMKAAQSNEIPADAVIVVSQQGQAINAHVQYERSVNILPFGLYKYQYKFDQTATPTGFLLKQ